MEVKTDVKPVRKIIKKIVRRVAVPVAVEAPVEITIPDGFVVASAPISTPSAKWTKDDDDKLREFIQNKMSVPDIAKIMNRSESAIRFQMKMVMYVDDRKDNNITNLLDGVKPNAYAKTIDVTKLYNDPKLINMITVYLFLDKMKDGNEYYGKLFDQVKKDCMNQIILGSF
ncbi:MAG: hypothetical protein Harvfovirus39_11 [Harvfovirus sp.]|uniref:Uncharacterized protein n=1 Tax=Harvfovirus sp. TaxID=2487768 RepID=A0A3G5A2T9_9VIRU|nr:MAG: hypothetical protein Harvfovirus39_11 [Harvfovirus sp.]